MDNNFKKLLATCIDTGRLYEPGLVFIGGIAVYLHAMNQKDVADFAEATHDADVYISLSGLSDMRDIEEMTQNARLSKHEFQKNGFSFDVYAERNSKLPIPYANVVAHAINYEGVLAAAPEHLLVMKLEAAIDRQGSEHGRKDAKDVIRLLLVGSKTDFDADLSVQFMRDDHLNHLHDIVKGNEFLSLTQGNSKLAKQLRNTCENLLKKIDSAYNSEVPPTPPRER